VFPRVLIADANCCAVVCNRRHDRALGAKCNTYGDRFGISFEQGCSRIGKRVSSGYQGR
jgi:hypothetical protein